MAKSNQMHLHKMKYIITKHSVRIQLPLSSASGTITHTLYNLKYNLGVPGTISDTCTSQSPYVESPLSPSLMAHRLLLHFCISATRACTRSHVTRWECYSLLCPPSTAAGLPLAPSLRDWWSYK